jgi:hypothetical protein
MVKKAILPVDNIFKKNGTAIRMRFTSVGQAQGVNSATVSCGVKLQ